MQIFETCVRQLSLVGGVSQTTSDLLCVTDTGSLLPPAAHKGMLYILVEADLLSPQSHYACQLAARTIQQTFYDDTTFSITAAMRRAVAAANKAVYQHNVDQPVGQRTSVGVTIAVLHGQNLFVAQIQPAQTYVLNEGVLRALPAHPSWDPAHVTAAPFTRGGALGTSLFIEPDLYRCKLRPFESVLICTSAFAPILSRDATDQILHLQQADAVLERLEQIARAHDLHDTHALILQLLPALNPTMQRQPVQPVALKEAAPGLTQRVREWFAQMTADPLRPPRRSVSAQTEESDLMQRLPDHPTYSVDPPPRPAPIDLGDNLERRYARSRQEGERKQRESSSTSTDLPPSTFLGEDTYPMASRRIDLGDGPALAASARPYRSRYEARPFVDLTWSERVALPFLRVGLMLDEARRNRKVRPTITPPTLRGQGLSYRRNRIAFPWLLLFVLSLVVSALIMYGMSLTRQNNQLLVLEYFTAAETQLALVRDASSELDALDALELAREAIDEVRASPTVTDTNPAIWLRYQEIQREYERALAAVQRVTFFDDLTILATHPVANATFTGIVVPPVTSTITNPNHLEAMSYIYTLDGDKANTQLYRIPHDGGTPQPYLSPGSPIGETIVGPVRSALWRIDQVVAVDQAPEGFGYYFRNGNEWNYSKLGGSEVWTVRDQLSIHEYDGNLYVWGAVPNEVLKFRSGSYGDTPEYWLDPASLTDIDLSNVIDMAVDGAIHLLKPNGTVLVFSQGLPIGEIKPEPITPPITAVTHFFVTSDGFGGGSIFLVETLSERIIQVDRLTGQVIQQMRVRADSLLRLDHLDSLFVDMSSGQPMLYIVNGDTIMRAELPAPPRPFREEEEVPALTPTVGP